MKRNELLSNCMSGYTEDAAEDAYALLSGIFNAQDLISECETVVASLSNITNGERTVDVFLGTFRLLINELWNRMKNLDDEYLSKRALVLRSGGSEAYSEALMEIFSLTAELVDAGKDEAQELADSRLKAVWLFCEQYLGE